MNCLTLRLFGFLGGNSDPTEPHYDLCFGGRREFCGGSYVDFGVCGSIVIQFLVCLYGDFIISTGPLLNNRPLIVLL